MCSSGRAEDSRHCWFLVLTSKFLFYFCWFLDFFFYFVFFHEPLLGAHEKKKWSKAIQRESLGITDLGVISRWLTPSLTLSKALKPLKVEQNLLSLRDKKGPIVVKAKVEKISMLSRSAEKHPVPRILFQYQAEVTC